MVGYAMATISGVFSGYYDLLGLALVILVPIWLWRFAYECVATIAARRRARRS